MVDSLVGLFICLLVLGVVLFYSLGADTWNAEECILFHHAWSFMDRLWPQVQWERQNLLRAMQMTHTLATSHSLNPGNSNVG